MHIRWTNHPHNPSLNGTKAHVPRSVAEVAVGYQQAEYVPPANYGTTEWLEERQAQSAAATGPSAYDTPTLAAGVIEWGLQHLKSGKANVIKKVGSDVYFYDVPPSDTPARIVRQYDDACAVNPEANRAAIEAAKRAQQERDRADKTAGHVAVMSAMFGSKPL
jgi:hypothetical protein